MLAASPNILAAIVFYAIYIGAITYFATTPAVAAGSARRALIPGAATGFVAYSTWVGSLTLPCSTDFTPIVMVDVLSGTFVTGTTAGMTYALARRIPALRPE